MSAPMSLTKMSIFRNSVGLVRLVSRDSRALGSLNRVSVSGYFGADTQCSISKLRKRLPKIFNGAYSFCTSASTSRKCWNCGSELEKEKEKFFCNCGVVQYIPTDISFFELMQCEETFDINIEKMSQLYKDLQRQYHPDKFSQRSKDEQSVAESQSSYINKAYTTLLKPLSRGLYLLELHGDPLEETNSAVDPEFLMEIMEINEDLAEAEGDTKAVEELEAINNKRINLCVKDISQSFAEGKVTEAKASLIKLKYFINIEDKIKEIHRMKM